MRGHGHRLNPCRLGCANSIWRGMHAGFRQAMVTGSSFPLETAHDHMIETRSAIADYQPLAVSIDLAPQVTPLFVPMLNIRSVPSKQKRECAGAK